MNYLKKYTLLILISLLFNIAYSRPPESVKTSNPNNNIGKRAAACSPSQTIQYMEINDVRALIETGGSMWQDRAVNVASYEVPAGSGKRVIYSGALWMGGLDKNGQLKIAAVSFRTNGNTDFWPGPLSFNPASVDTSGDLQGGSYNLGSGAATVDDVTCREYDKFFYMKKQDVIDFVNYKKAVNENNVDELYPDGYSIPDEIVNWPGNGLVSGYDKNMAPYYDGNNDGVYDPVNTSYPNLDFPHYVYGDSTTLGYVDCRTYRRVTLFGDETFWWVFNDKGNVHTETGGDPIGMEIRAQAFAFSTNDEVNKMTFYNYEMINRSTQTLTNTYFGQWVDPDVGDSQDDYVGCDVQRGLGYAYNGDNFDDDFNGNPGYGANPPAVGIDFFEGPFQDIDGKDNPGPTLDNNFFVSYEEANINDGILYKGMGIGYGDGIVDNERFGMRKFVYYTLTGTNQTGDPSTAAQYYNYLQGLWKDGTKYYYDGGNGTQPNGIEADYIFPGNTDPQGWGTGGNTTVDAWDEFSAGNQSGDRRFMQSAGPFTLEPGQVNNITVGVVFGQSGNGDANASIQALKTADDKAQNLFDNCFQILEGPHAPQLVAQELDQEIILQLIPDGNNSTEQYIELDNTIPEVLYNGVDTTFLNDSARSYVFEGYQVYQVLNSDVKVDLLDDPNYARLVIQTDFKNGVAQLINYDKDEILGQVPVEKVPGQGESDNGIAHSFQILEDAFAVTDKNLVNNKTYYYIVVSYAYNNYKNYDINDPASLDGQKAPYLRSRKNGNGTSITSYAVTPNKPEPRNNGTILNSSYGDVPNITRIEGKGNSNNVIELTKNSEDEIVSNYFMKTPTYKKNKGPFAIKVVDPISVSDVKFRVEFNSFNYPAPTTSSSAAAQRTHDVVPDSVTWKAIVMDQSNNVLDTIYSEQTIGFQNEQILTSYGVSININQYQPLGTGYDGKFKNEVLENSMVFEDSLNQWIDFIADIDGVPFYNWILSGSYDDDNNPKFSDWNRGSVTAKKIDQEEIYETLIERKWAPYRMTLNDTSNSVSNNYGAKFDKIDLDWLPTVKVVLTSDQSKWTRSPVIEMQYNKLLSKYDPNFNNGQFNEGSDFMKLRRMPSVDKNGNPDNSLAPDGTPSYGMGWFPGYAINVSTGERLNIVFGEDSFYAKDNGNDMLFNPTSTLFEPVNNYVMGGKHNIYIFDNADVYYPLNVGSNDRYPAAGRYNGGSSIENLFRSYQDGNVNRYGTLWMSAIYSAIPVMPADKTEADWLDNDLSIYLNVASKYARFATDDNDYRLENIELSQNDWLPTYEVNMSDLATQTNQSDAAKSALDLVKVVPNPYYAYSGYETDKLDNRVKIINLPPQCTVTIYNANGTLVRTFRKDSDITSIDWDLKNEQRIPIAGGVYIIHVNSPGVGETVVKWFGSLRPPDLENF